MAAVGASLSPSSPAYFASLTAAVDNAVAVAPVTRRAPRSASTSSASAAAASSAPSSSPHSVSAGKGLLLGARPVRAGEVVFVEQALGTLQHSRNSVLVQACEHCKRFVGTLESQLARLLTVRLSPAQRASLPPGRARELERGLRAAFPPLAASFRAPAIDDSSLAPVVPCSRGCRDVYCSSSCRVAAWRKYHALLCPGPSDEDEGEDEELVGEAGEMGTGAGSAEHSHDHGHRHSHGGAEGDDEDDEAEVEVDDDTAAAGAAAMEDDAEINAAALFQHQALATNEIFGLAGRMYGRILATWARNGNNLAQAVEPFRVLHAQPWSVLFALQQEGVAMRNSAEAASASAAGDDAMGEGEDAESDSDSAKAAALEHLQDQVREWLRDSLTILRSLVVARLPALVSAVEEAAVSPAAGASASAPASRARSRTSLSASELDVLLSPEAYERMVGAFELNNIELKVDSPLRDYLSVAVGGRGSALAVLSPVLRQALAARDARRQLTRTVTELLGDDDDDDGEEEGDEDDCRAALELPADAHGPALRVPLSLFPVCDGTALFALTCCCNHSCEPNVQLRYGDDGTGMLVALRDLSPGDELCINYVGVEQPRALRQADLKHYGFSCCCERCEKEGD